MSVELADRFPGVFMRNARRNTMSGPGYSVLGIEYTVPRTVYSIRGGRVGDSIF